MTGDLLSDQYHQRRTTHAKGNIRMIVKTIKQGHLLDRTVLYHINESESGMELLMFYNKVKTIPCVVSKDQFADKDFLEEWLYFKAMALKTTANNEVEGVG